ncbi:MAG: DUF3226 domain-containing protein [Flavobacterium sp.]
METQIVALLCEGPHDAEFLSRILRFNGFSSNDGLEIKNYPSPINNFLKTEAIKTNIDDLNLITVRHVLLPYCTLRNENSFFLIYSMIGVGQKEKRKQLLNDFFTLIPKENEYNEHFPIGTELGISYFFDADDKGIDTRTLELNEEINEVLGIKPFNSHKEIYIHQGLKLSSFIFTGNDNSKGKLEDLLMPLMKKDNETIFDNADDFLANHFDDERKAQKYDKDKSIIGIVGQLQISGASNTVCIKKSDYLNEEKIKENYKCKEIVDFINSHIIK